ncbi:MAG: BON domain-containing protein [Proteobacteria bacterium]|nr:BON domain-containing protein [Pseudomonadota bacterium]
MRTALFAILIAAGLAACDKPQPASSVAPVPVAAKPLPVQPQAPQPAPVAEEPRPSADELLATRVKSALRDTRKVDGQGVGVTVAGGVVTLYGTAPAAEESRNIAAFVGGVEGVRSVVNKLVIVRGS